ncbi:MAG: GTPase [Gemmataceae bacterium]
METAPVTDEPLLRTLAPALRALHTSLRAWLDVPHYHPLSTITRATLDGIATDLGRKAESFDQEKPLLVVMLMGGTGVGKSTLLNALAGGVPIAQASFARPTTRDPVVYYHQSVQSHTLDPALQHCRLVHHDRPELRQKVIVDTPDLDSNDLANRDTMMRVMPVADIVLYVGSQEKYHDKLGWELFLQQRKRRAFAFVLNKWDRCSQAYTHGVRPDEDLLADLQNEGFEKPLLFRTCAQYWVDRAQNNGQSTEELTEGEQFEELVHWLELGLTRLEIEAIKARGVSQALNQLQRSLQNAMPPDVAKAAERTKVIWTKRIREAATQDAEILLDTLEPYQKELEHHFANQRQGYFWGVTAWYLALVNKIKYAGSSLRDHIPLMPKSQTQSAAPVNWNLETFTSACAQAAGEKHIDSSMHALSDKLLVQASEQGFPLNLLNEPTEEAAKLDWRSRYSQALIEVLGQVEHQWTKPTGWRKGIRNTVVILANFLPPLVLVVTVGLLVMQILQLKRTPYLSDFLVPVAAMAATMFLMHVLIVLFLPLRWSAIRSQFRKLLEKRLNTELEKVYTGIPGEVVQQLAKERKQIEKMQAEVREVTEWLESREKAASIVGLYGNEEE